jgi:hypothetical protein
MNAFWEELSKNDPDKKRALITDGAGGDRSKG